MAEPFGIAASALQVAGAGLKLAETLKAYTDSVRKAEKQLKPVADHVKLTANVLTNVGSLLKNDDIRGLYTKELLGSTSNALGGCRTAFEDLEKFISKLLKTSEGSGSKVSIQTSARFTLYFKQKELDVLQAHLERFKSSLDLVLGVLNLASSARSAKDTSVIAGMKADIQRLIQAELDAKKKEASLVTSHSPDTSQLTDSARSTTSRELPPMSSTSRSFPAAPIMKSFAVAGTTSRAINPKSKDTSTSWEPYQRLTTPEEAVLHYLTKCADAAAQLSIDIERAIGKWNGSGETKTRELQEVFQSINRARHSLELFEEKKAKSKDPPQAYIEHSKAQVTLKQESAGASHTGRNDVLSSQTEMLRLRYSRPLSPTMTRRRSRSSSFEYQRERRRGNSRARSRSRSRSRSQSASRKQLAGLKGVAAVGALAAYAMKTKDRRETLIVNDRSPTRGSRSRRRRVSLDGSKERVTNKTGQLDPEYRNRRIAQAGLASAAAASLFERNRSRDRGSDQDRSRSRQRQAVPIAAAGLGGGALSGLYEKRNAKKGSRPLTKELGHEPDADGIVNHVPPSIEVEKGTPSSDSSSNASDQRDDILNLAEPERVSSSEPRDDKIQKRPSTFQCHLCQEMFTRPIGLRSHLRTHTEGRPFKCAVCEVRFQRQHDCERHEALHSTRKNSTERLISAPRRPSTSSSDSEAYQSVDLTAFGGAFNPRMSYTDVPAALSESNTTEADLVTHGDSDNLGQGAGGRESGLPVHEGRPTGIITPQNIMRDRGARDAGRHEQPNYEMQRTWAEKFRSRDKWGPFSSTRIIDQNSDFAYEDVTVGKRAVEVKALTDEIDIDTEGNRTEHRMRKGEQTPRIEDSRWEFDDELSDIDSSEGAAQSIVGKDESYATTPDAPDLWAVGRVPSYDADVEEDDEDDEDDDLDIQSFANVDDLLRQWTTLSV